MSTDIRMRMSMSMSMNMKTRKLNWFSKPNATESEALRPAALEKKNPYPKECGSSRPLAPL